ncbi:MAG TPA: trehalose-phosphatase [Terriglobales bacterium]|nr:trehalose-phosphatase [Terriglobales bacterium]
MLLDYDGTLAPFQTQRNQAFPYPGVALLLQEIVRDACSRVVVISGREVTDLLPLIDIHPRPEIWGIHGLQRLRTDGTTEMPHLDDRTLQGLSDAERWLSYKHLRHRAEFKPGGIAVHWRGLPPLDAADLRARVLLGWRPIVAEHNAMGDRGLTVLVRPEWRESSAQLWLSPPGELIEFLQLWLKSCASGQRGYSGGARVVNL